MKFQSKLILVIETSSRPFSVVLSDENDIMFNSSDQSDLANNSDLSLLVNHGLSLTGRTVDEISMIAVDIGPGGLSSVRSGVAFANGLAFGLKLPVCPFVSFELLGFEAWKKFKMPVLCSAKASEGNAYVGLYDKGKILKMRFGLLDTVVKEVVADLSEVVVAGAHMDFVSKMSNDINFHHSGVSLCKARTFIDMSIVSDMCEKTPCFPAVPLNEQSSVFYE